MDDRKNVEVKYVLHGKILNSKEVEANKEKFDVKCFSSVEKTSAILKLRENTSSMKSSILYIHQDLTFSTEKMH